MKEWEKPLKTNVGTQLYSNIIAMLTQSAWAITPSWLDQIHSIVGRKMHGIELGKDILDGMDYSHRTQVRNGAAIIPVQGPLFKKANMMTQLSGATSMELVKGDLQKALLDDSVKQIILSIDSPGGTIDGTKELADFIYESRGVKPITAYVDGMAASAAYWIASAADSIVASSETALIGSVGVIAAHYDYSKYYEKEGVKKTYIYQGRYKGMGREAEPLSAEGKGLIQAEIDGLYGVFIDSIATNLGISSDEALSKTDNSRVFNSKDALKSGLIHEIKTLDSIIGGDYARSGNLAGLSMDAFTHNDTTAKNEPAWGGVEKSKLPRIAHAEMGEEGKKSTWGYPHHWVSGAEKLDTDGVYVDGTLYLHKKGVSAAWGAAHGAQSGKKASQSVISHLKSHRKALGMEAEWEMGQWSSEAEEMFGSDFNDIFKGWACNIKSQNNKEEKLMTAEEIRSKFQDAVKIIESEATKGMVSQSDYETAVKERDESKAKAGELEIVSKAQKEKLAEQTAELAVARERGLAAEAKAIQDGILAESGLPETIHGDIAQLIDFHGYVKEGEAFTAESESGKAYAAAMTAKVKDFEAKLGCKPRGVGLGDSKFDASGSHSQEEDEKYGQELARRITGKIRSDNK